MFQRRMDFSWAFLFILVCLFILSVMAPRGWQRVSRNEGIARLPVPSESPESPASPLRPTQEPGREVANQLQPAALHAQVPNCPFEVPVAPALATEYSLEAPMPPSAPNAPTVAEPAPLPVESTVSVAAPPDVAPMPEPAADPIAPVAPPAEPVATETKEAPATPDQPVEVPGEATVNVQAPQAPAHSDQFATADPNTAIQPVSPEPQAIEPIKPVDPPQVVKEPEPRWQEPEALIARLDALAARDATRRWGREAADLVRKLGPAIAANSGEAGPILQQLNHLTAQAPALVATIRDRAAAQDLSRTSYAVARRLALWRQIGQPGAVLPADAAPSPAAPDSINQCLTQIDALTRNSEEGKAWRRFLLVDNLREWAGRRKSADERMPREMAQQVLKRLNHVSLSQHQRQFLSSGPVAALETEMLRHAGPADPAQLFTHLERYEQTGLPSDARLVAEDCRCLAASRDPAKRRLAEQGEMHYRNANIRFAISAQLLNRMAPKRKPEYAPVTDTVLGMPVRGNSMTSSAMAVRLLPDPQRIRLALEVSGQVSSLTSSDAGMATFLSDSQATYVAQKPLEVDLKGIKLGQTEVEVDNSAQLRRVDTGWNGVPIFGRLAQNVAKSEYERKQPLANAEVQQKIAAKVQERVDEETTSQLTQVAKRLQQNVLGPMHSLALDPAMIAAETTEQRFVARVRLAGKDQLGSHTPRPQAPADALASFQVHESVLNNVLDRLELDGRTFTLPELSRHLAQRLSRPQLAEESPDREDVTITFAERDAVRVRCAEGKVEITLSVARLTKPPRVWKDFQVRATYKPEIAGRNGQLARDGVIQLIGRVSVGGQIALRGVFAKTFGKTAPWNLLPDRMAKDPNLTDIGITQFTIDDGWIGVALGQQRTAALPGGMRR